MSHCQVIIVLFFYVNNIFGQFTGTEVFKWPTNANPALKIGLSTVTLKDNAKI